MSTASLYRTVDDTAARLANDPLHLVRFAEAYLSMAIDVCSLLVKEERHDDTVLSALQALFLSLANSASSTKHPRSHVELWTELNRMVEAAAARPEEFSRQHSQWENKCIRQAVTASAETLAAVDSWPADSTQVAAMLHLMRNSAASSAG